MPGVRAIIILSPLKVFEDVKGSNLQPFRRQTASAALISARDEPEDWAKEEALELRILRRMNTKRQRMTGVKSTGNPVTFGSMMARSFCLRITGGKMEDQQCN